MIDMKEFVSRVVSLQQGLWKTEENVSAQKATLDEKTTEKALEGMQFFLMMYMVYKFSTQNLSEMASLIKTYEEEAIKEVSRQAEKAGEEEEHLSNDPIMAAIKSMLHLPDLETVEGAYIQQIYRVGNLHRDFCGVPRPAEE